MNKTRFDLEQEIMECWNVTTDIDNLIWHKVEQNANPDQVLDYLMSMKTLYEVKFNKLFATFEEVVRNRDI